MTTAKQHIATAVSTVRRIVADIAPEQPFIISAAIGAVANLLFAILTLVWTPAQTAAGTPLSSPSWLFIVRAILLVPCAAGIWITVRRRRRRVGGTVAGMTALSDAPESPVALRGGELTVAATDNDTDNDTDAALFGRRNMMRALLADIVVGSVLMIASSIYLTAYENERRLQLLAGCGTGTVAGSTATTNCEMLPISQRIALLVVFLLMEACHVHFAVNYFMAKSSANAAMLSAANTAAQQMRMTKSASVGAASAAAHHSSAPGSRGAEHGSGPAMTPSVSSPAVEAALVTQSQQKAL